MDFIINRVFNTLSRRMFNPCDIANGRTSHTNKDEAAIPAHRECPGEVTASACTNKSSYPAEVMKKKLREKVYTAYGTDAVWLFNTTLSGTELSVMEWRTHAVNKCS